MSSTVWTMPSQKSWSPPTVKKRTRRAANFCDTVRPVYIVSRIFGLMPFTLHHHANGHIDRSSVGLFDIFWFIGAIAINLTMIYYTVLSLLEPSFTLESSILQDGSRVLSICAMVMIVLSIALDMFNRKRLVKILKDLTAYDKNVRMIVVLLKSLSDLIFVSQQIEKYGTRTDFERSRRAVIISIIFLSLVILLLIFLTYFASDVIHALSPLQLFVKFFTFALLYGSFECVMKKYHFLIIHIRSRFEQIQNLMR